MVLIEYVPPGLFDPEQARVLWQDVSDYEVSHDQVAPVRLNRIVSTTEPIGDVVGHRAESTYGKAAPENPEEQRLIRAFEKVLIDWPAHHRLRGYDEPKLVISRSCGCDGRHDSAFLGF